MLSRLLGKWGPDTPRARLLLAQCTRTPEMNTPRKAEPEARVEVVLFSGQRLGFVPAGSATSKVARLAVARGFAEHVEDVMCTLDGGKLLKNNDTVYAGPVLVSKSDGAFKASSTYLRANIAAGNSVMTAGPRPDEVTLVAPHRKQQKFIAMVVNVRTGNKVARWAIPTRTRLGGVAVTVHREKDRVLVHNQEECSCFQLLRNGKVRRLSRAAPAQRGVAIQACFTGCGRYLVLVNGATLVFHDLSGKKQHKEYIVPSQRLVLLCGPADGPAVFCAASRAARAPANALQKCQILRISITDRTEEKVFAREGSVVKAAVNRAGTMALFVDRDGSKHFHTKTKSFTIDGDWDVDFDAGVFWSPLSYVPNAADFWPCDKPVETERKTLLHQRHASNTTFLATCIVGDGRTHVVAYGRKPQRAGQDKRPMRTIAVDVSFSCLPIPVRSY